MSDGTNFMWLLSKVRFKCLEANTIMLFMEALSNGSFSKLVLTFFEWLECLPKILWFSSSTKILNFYFL